MFFLNPANHIRFFSVILESDIDLEYIHWTLTPFQLEKFQLKVSQYVCYIIWESHCTKIIVARLLKLIVLYILFVSMNQHATQILRPNFLEQGLQKDLDQLKSSFFR